MDLFRDRMIRAGFAVLDETAVVFTGFELYHYLAMRNIAFYLLFELFCQFVSFLNGYIGGYYQFEINEFCTTGRSGTQVFELAIFPYILAERFEYFHLTLLPYRGVQKLKKGVFCQLKGRYYEKNAYQERGDRVDVRSEMSDGLL